MNDLEVIAECLPQINPAALEYDEWLAVGMAVKQAGGSVEMWDTWSQRDSGRYHPNECRKKWEGFRGSANPVGVGSIVKLCRDQGGDVSFGSDPAAGQGRPLDWDFVLPDDDLKIVRQEWLQESQIPPRPRKLVGARRFSNLHLHIVQRRRIRRNRRRRLFRRRQVDAEKRRIQPVRR